MSFACWAVILLSLVFIAHVLLDSARILGINQAPGISCHPRQRAALGSCPRIRISVSFWCIIWNQFWFHWKWRFWVFLKRLLAKVFHYHSCVVVFFKYRIYLRFCCKCLIKLEVILLISHILLLEKDRIYIFPNIFWSCLFFELFMLLKCKCINFQKWTCLVVRQQACSQWPQ